jgi:hypothetical protein
MKSITLISPLLALAIACSDDHELAPDQGACTNLDEMACTADPRCQQAYENSGHQPAPFAEQCVLVEAGPASTAACETLSFEQCRARNDCSLIYWQDLGPDDGPVGDPYYKSCATEGTL